MVRALSLPALLSEVRVWLHLETAVGKGGRAASSVVSATRAVGRAGCGHRPRPRTAPRSAALALLVPRDCPAVKVTFPATLCVCVPNTRLGTVTFPLAPPRLPPRMSCAGHASLGDAGGGSGGRAFAIGLTFTSAEPGGHVTGPADPTGLGHESAFVLQKEARRAVTAAEESHGARLSMAVATP